MRRRVWAASLLVVLVGCSSGGSSSPTTPAPTRAATTAPGTTARPATGNGSTSTAGGTTSAADRPAAGSPTTTAADSDSPSTSTPDGATTAAGAPTTNVPAAPCDAATLLVAAQQAFGPLPEGAAATDPRCVETWATAVLTAPGQDNALAVFDNPEGEWMGRNLGTDQVCSGAGVPLDFFGPLGCGPWEG